MSSHDHAKVAFSMASLGHSARNVDEFGGVPFLNHAGNKCHRGVNPHKKSDFHPSETAKRCIYQTDGSGRDMYITCNNGGLSVTNQSFVNGSDTQTLYAGGLRGYLKDKVTYGFNRSPVSVRIADQFIRKTL